MLSFKQFLINEVRTTGHLSVDSDNVSNDNTKLPRGKSIIPNTGDQKKSVTVDKSVKNWHATNVEQSDGHLLLPVDAYEHYAAHTIKNKSTPLSMPHFTRQWLDHSGHRLNHFAGAARHIGVKLKEHYTVHHGKMVIEMRKGKQDHADLNDENRETWHDHDGVGAEKDSKGNSAVSVDDGIFHVIKHHDGKTYSATDFEDEIHAGKELSHKTIHDKVKDRNPHLTDDQASDAAKLIRKVLKSK